MKIISVVGARPQFVKAGVVSRVLGTTAGVEELLVHTGQHYDENMSQIFFDELEIPRPAYDLGIGSASHGEQTGLMLARIEGILVDERPDWVLVYGDTNSTLAGALAAAKLHIPVAHVESGLRSFNRRMPEEVNRVVADHVADMLFAPTETAVANLLREGISEKRIHKVGDVMYDAAKFYSSKTKQNTKVLEDCGVNKGEYLLATIHRAENTDNPMRLRTICQALSEVSADWPVVLPLHPRTRKMLRDFQVNLSAQVRIIDPVGYLDMMTLEMNSKVIATDSGGVQKEAYFHRIPCITLRDETEWVELVAMGWNRVVPPTDLESMVVALREAKPPSEGEVEYPFGRGDSAQQIYKVLTAGSARSLETEVAEL